MRRILAVIIVVLLACLFAYSTAVGSRVGGATLLPVVLALVGIVGATGVVQIRLRVLWEAAATVGIVLLVKYMFDNHPGLLWEGAKHLGSPNDERLNLTFILLALFQLFLKRSRGISPLFLIYAAMALGYCGNQFSSPGKRKLELFQASSYAFVVLSAAFCATFMHYRREALRRRLVGRVALQLALLVAVLLCAWFLGLGLRAAENPVNDSLRFLLEKRSPSGRMGYSTDVTLRHVMDLRYGADNDAVAVRVISDEPPGYLRADVFSRFRRSSWDASEMVTEISPLLLLPDGLSPEGEPWAPFRIAPGDAKPWKRFEVWPSVNTKGALFHPTGTAILFVPVDELRVKESGTAGALGLARDMSYVAAVPSGPARDRLDDERRDELYLSVSRRNRRLQDMAEDIFAGLHTPLEKAEALERYFQENYEYSLVVNIPTGEDALHSFLVNKLPAHCEYFASGAVVLLRLGGVPARLVTGFVVVEREPGGGCWIARNRDAHAWVEAYDPEAGWFLVEPTPPSGRPTFGKRPSSGWWERFRFRVRQLLVLARTAGVRGVLRWLRMRLVDVLGMVVSLTPLGLAVKGGIVVGLIALVYWRWRPRQERRRDRQFVHMNRLLERVEASLKAQGYERLEHETLSRFVGRLSAADDMRCVQAADWYRRYIAMRYGGVREDDAVRQLEESLPGA